MKTVKKTLEIPISVMVKDQNGNVIGSGSGTVTIEYQYEVPDITDYITKGSLPAIFTDIIFRVVRK